MPEILAFLRTPLGLALLFGALSVWPLARIARRIGRPPALAALAFVPVVGLPLALAALLVGPWPDPPARPALPPGSRDRSLSRAPR